MTSHHASESIGHLTFWPRREGPHRSFRAAAWVLDARARIGRATGTETVWQTFLKANGLRGKHDSRTRWVGGRPSIGIGSKGKWLNRIER